jgi:hypothetical protein
MVRMKDIIGIFDIHVQTSPYTARFIEYAKHNDAIEVVEVGDMYYSPISSLTLKKRANILDHGGKADSESV